MIRQNYHGVNFNIKNLPALVRLSDYYPDIVECLDQKCAERGITHGISHYWLAKYFSMLSKNNLHIVQVRGGEHERPRLLHRINNLFWYDEKFEFIIIDTNSTKGGIFIDKSIILERFGQPADIFTCHNLEVWVYNRPDDIAFHSQFTHSFNLQDEIP